MSSFDEISLYLEELFTSRARSALEQLGFRPVGPRDLRPVIAGLRHHLPPAYLPFATFDGEPLAIHLSPGRAPTESPIVHLAIGSRAPNFVCAKLADLPVGLWLWTAAYFSEKKQKLRDATSLLAREIPDAREVPDALWNILDTAPDGEPTWWSHRVGMTTKVAWLEADVGHPFVGLTDLDDENARQALAELEREMSRANHPEASLVATLLGTRAELGMDLNPELVLLVLRSEAWLGGEPPFLTDWIFADEGLALWSLALRLASAETLTRTPFEPLIGHPDTYSGGDQKGTMLLEAVAGEFARQSAWSRVVAQLRNAMFVSLYTKGSYSSEQCEASADACDHVNPNHLAGVLARATAQISAAEA